MNKILLLTLSLISLVSHNSFGQMDANRNFALQAKLGFAEAVQTQGKGNWLLNFSGTYRSEVSEFQSWDYSLEKFILNKTLINQQIAYGILDRLDVYGAVGLRNFWRATGKSFFNGTEVNYYDSHLSLMGGITYHAVKQKGGRPNILISAELGKNQMYGDMFRTHLLWHYALGSKWNIRGQFGYGIKNRINGSNEFLSAINAMYDINNELGIFVGGKIDYRNYSGRMDIYPFGLQSGVNWNINDRWMVSGNYTYLDVGSIYGWVYNFAHQGELKASFGF